MPQSKAEEARGPWDTDPRPCPFPSPNLPWMHQDLAGRVTGHNGPKLSHPKKAPRARSFLAPA